MQMSLPSGRSLELFIRHYPPNPDGSCITIRYPSGDPGLAIRGRTVAVVKVDGQEYAAPAVCSAHDTFCRHRGVQVSVARVLRAAGLTKDDRTAVWAKVFSGKYGERP